MSDQLESPEEPCHTNFLSPVNTEEVLTTQEFSMLNYNLNLLRDTHPSIRDWIKSMMHCIEPTVVQWHNTIEHQTINQIYQVSSRHAEVKGTHLHHPTHPEQEAKDLAKHWNKLYQGKATIPVFGLGLGFHVEALLEIMAPHQTLELQLFDRHVFQKALCCRNFDKIFSDPRLEFVAHLNPETACMLPALQSLLSNKPHDHLSVQGKTSSPHTPAPHHKPKSHRPALYFMHIPKTGGTYVKTAMKHELGKKFFLLSPGGTKENKQKALDQYLSHENTVSFSTVRNPYDLFVSWWCSGHQWHGHRKWLSSFAFNPSTHHMQHANLEPKENGFKNFVLSFLENKNSRFKKDQHWQYYQSQFLFFQFFNQEGKCSIDYVIQNEFLTPSLRKLCLPFQIEPVTQWKRSQLKEKGVNHAMKESDFSHLNQGDDNDHINKVNISRTDKVKYQDFYDEELKQAVSHYCRRELDAFGYTFEGNLNPGAIISTKHIQYNPHTNEFDLDRHADISEYKSSA